MKWIFDMAMRNLRRNKRRTVLAVTSIALSVTLMTFMGGFTQGVLNNMVKNITKNETGHIRITTKGFEDRSRFMPVDELIANPAEIIAAIKASADLSESVETIAERILFGTLLSNGPNAKAAFGFAGDPETEKGLLNLNRSIAEGSYLSGSGETIIGKKLAADLDLKVGGSLRVVTQGADYGLHLKRFKIAGIFSTGLNQLDGGAFQIPVSDAKELLRTDGGVQQIVLMLKDYRKAEETARLVSAAVAGTASGKDLIVRPWSDIGDYPRLIRVMEKMYGWIFLVIAFLGAFIITNILMMVVMERKREIGILKSMGLKRREVLALFLTEGAAMGAIGSGIGAAAGLALCGVFSVYGMDFSTAVGSMTFPVDPIYHTTFNVLSALQMFALGLFVSMIVSILPSRRAATMNAVDAIKSVA